MHVMDQQEGKKQRGGKNNYMGENYQGLAVTQQNGRDGGQIRLLLKLLF